MLLFFAIISCSPETFDPIPYGPVSDGWDEWADEIAKLKSPGTPKYDWDQKASTGSTQAVTSESDIRQIISRYEDMTDEERGHLLDLFSRARGTVHYGFEGDFRALVFFDEDNRTIDAFLMGN